METQDTQPSETQEAGLLDSVAPDDNQGQTDPSNTEVSHLNQPEGDDDEPLERPDWWPENFWKKDEAAPDLEAIAKSWQDLRKQISQGKHKPPADGKYDTASFGDIPDDDPVRNYVVNWAGKYGISQGALDELVGEVVAMQGEGVERVERTVAQEKAELGPNADAMIKGATDWANSLYRKGIFGKDDFEEFKYAAGTAKGLKMMLKLRESYEGTRIPASSAPIDGAPSKEELYQMVGDPKYKTDPAFRAKVERLFAQNFG
jgi:hypothetical protein